MGRRRHAGAGFAAVSAYGNVSDLNAGAGRTWYDALQTKVERRFGSWHIMLASYVYSKSLGQLTYRQIFTQSTNVQTQDAYNLNDAKSLPAHGSAACVQLAAELLAAVRQG